MEISICTGVFGPESREASGFERAAGMAAVAGYRLVEPSGSHLRLPNSHSALAAAGLEVWAVHGSFGCVEPGAISESADERRHTLDRELELLHLAAAYAPCPYVILLILHLVFDSELKQLKTILKSTEIPRKHSTLLNTPINLLSSIGE